MKDKEKTYEINPCQRCPLKDGYGGEYRCSICELTFLRKETERLNKKLKKQNHKDSVVNTPTIQCETYSQNDMVVLTKEEYAELKQAKSLLEFREETIKHLEDANIRYAKALELKVNEKERKEMAEKILKDLKLLVPDNALGIVTRYFKQILGVEIKE